ncbi:MAG: PHP domain-containing protein, partial [Acholeplasmatales bacterium]|nr:PHP domain-containing protein [Acholeplasmatales bacterium]
MIRSIFIQSEYSLLKSLIKIPDLVKEAVYQKSSHLVLTDDNLGGLLEFINHCQPFNLTPIVGLFTKIKFSNWEDFFIIIPKTPLGYQYLLEINYQQNLQGFISLNIVQTMSRELLFISAGLDSLAYQHLVHNNIGEAFKLMSYY